MKISSQELRLSASDLSNHLACCHLSALDFALAHGQIKEPQLAAPDLVVIQQLGLRHEADYLKHLREIKKLDVKELPVEGDPKALLERTRNLMEQGVDAIAQGALASEEWYGRPDVLLKVPNPRLFEAECRTPRQMQLANALCRFRELALEIHSI